MNFVHLCIVLRLRIEFQSTTSSQPSLALVLEGPPGLPSRADYKCHIPPQACEPVMLNAGSVCVIEGGDPGTRRIGVNIYY